MRRATEPLFARESLGDYLRGELREAAGVVTARDADWLLERTDDEVVDELMAARAVPHLEIHWEKATTPGIEETTVDVQRDVRYGGAGRGTPVLVPADEVAITVPFTGERDLLFMQPSTFSLAPPHAQVRAHELVFRLTQPKLTLPQVTSAFEGFRAQVDKLTATANADVDAHNSSLEAAFRARVAERRARLLEQRALTASLPFDIRPTGVAPTYPVDIRPKKIHLSRPSPAQPFSPQPALEDAMYEHILETIVAAAHQLERAPDTFLQFGEDDLRNQLLVPLNIAYKGQAGAERFSRAGKTDIHIMDGDKAVFVAECKIWKGQKKVVAAVDQLLSYMVWRDSKAAIVLFIRGGQATDIIAKADAAITGHEQCARRYEPRDPGSRIDYLLRSTADDQRLIHTALLPVVIAGRRPAEAEGA